MRVLVSGSSGLIGRGLVKSLKASGHEVVRLVRRLVSDEEPDISWDPAGGHLDPASIEGFDAVVHLAGDNVASGRWTTEKKEHILTSRVDGTRLLAETIAALDAPPKVLASASAVGYYGNRGDEELVEGSPAGHGFLAKVCRQWEAAAAPVETKGVRLALLRIGIVLDRHGGALTRMLPVFSAGLGGCMGNGRQYVSWITRGDLLAAIERILEDDMLSGPINLTAPAPATNRQLTKALGHALHRPTLLRMPAFLLRLTAGEMADEMLLASARVLPRKLLSAGFEFQDDQIEVALARVLGSPAAAPEPQPAEPQAEEAVQESSAD